jgi:hypothetical protein
MGMTCLICRSEKRNEINLALVQGMGMREIVKQYGASLGALSRHRGKCGTGGAGPEAASIKGQSGPPPAPVLLDGTILAVEPEPPKAASVASQAMSPAEAVAFVQARTRAHDDAARVRPPEPFWPSLPKRDEAESEAAKIARTPVRFDPPSDLLRDDGERPHDHPGFDPSKASMGTWIGRLF